MSSERWPNGDVSSTTTLSRQSRRLLQAGMALILYSFIEGFAIPFLGSARIGLSVHTLSAYQGVLLMTQGFLWPRLRLGGTAASIAFWSALLGAVAILAAYTVAAIWGVGIETIRLMGELPHGLTRGSPFQETFIKILAYSSGPPGLVWIVLVLWGLRNKGEG
jgi:(hydroxyamino)benzene mutase